MSSTSRLSTLLVVVACLGFALGLSNCGPQPCSSATCPTGCCGSTGRCETGSSSAACGRLGGACLSCSISQSCSAGTCMNQGFGAGGTGGSGTVGGGSAGGGSAGGGTVGGGSAVGGGSTAGGRAGGAAGGGSAVGGGRAGGSATGGGSGGGGSQSCTVSGTCPVNTCRCGDNTVLTSQFCNNNICQTGASECSRACIAGGHPPPGGTGGGSAGGGGAGGGSACNGAFALGSNFTTGTELYVQCNTFPSPTNCLTGKYINFEGVSGPLAACFCYAVCPNGVTAGQVCSTSTPDLICTRVRNTAGTSMALMCLPPGAAWQNLCRG